MQIPGELESGLAAVLERLLPLLRQMATAGDLSVPSASLLARLVRDGPQRLTDLAAHEAVTQPGMTQLVARLERDGLAQRSPGSDDRRVVVVAATDEGRGIVARRRAERVAALRELLGELEAADRAAICGALPALARLTDLAPPPGLPPGRAARAISAQPERAGAAAGSSGPEASHSPRAPRAGDSAPASPPGPGARRRAGPAAMPRARERGRRAL